MIPTTAKDENISIWGQRVSHTQNPMELHIEKKKLRESVFGIGKINQLPKKSTKDILLQ